MKRTIQSTLAVLVGTAACGLVADQASAAIIEFNFPITASQEVPPPTVLGDAVQPSGIGSVTYDTDTNEFSYIIGYVGLTGSLTSAHVHGPAPIGAVAGVAFPISAGAGASGLIIGTTTISEAEEADLLAGLMYVNIHTAENPAGEIRGQIVNVPEPGSLALVGAGALCLIRRRRQA